MCESKTNGKYSIVQIKNKWAI